jgi:type III restriction enzyme
VPVADDSGTGETPTYRDLWLRVRDELPKKGRGTDAVTGEPKLPLALQGALHTLYSNYEAYYRRWEQDTGGAGTRRDAARLHRCLPATPTCRS